MFANAPFGELLRAGTELIDTLVQNTDPIEYDGDYIRIFQKPGDEPKAHLLPKYKKKPYLVQKPVSIPVATFDKPIERFKKQLQQLSPRNHELEQLVERLQISLGHSRQYTDTDDPRYVMPRVEGPLLDEIKRQVRRYDTGRVVIRPLDPANLAGTDPPEFIVTMDSTTGVESVVVRPASQDLRDGKIVERLKPSVPGKKLREPTTQAFTAYRAAAILGKKQRDVATQLCVDQGTVSRWVRQVAAWVEAGNILPDLDLGRPGITSMDPRKLEQGANPRRPRK